MSREFLTEFIQMYENEPCLWQVSSKHYHDRNKKEVSYAKLLTKLKEVNAKATKDDVIKKINNMRSALRKEKKKIKESLKSGASADTVYKPKLWYFSLLGFLCDQDINRTSQSNVDTDDDGIDEENTSETDIKSWVETKSGKNIEERPPLLPSAQLKAEHSSPSMKKESKGPIYAPNDFQCFHTSINSTVKDDDSFDAFGISVAKQLRKLSEERALLAQSAIQNLLTEYGIQDLREKKRSRRYCDSD